PMLFFSGVYFPVKVFPFAIQLIVSLIPLALGIEGMRELMVFGNSPLQILWIYIVLLLLGIVFFYIATKMIKYMEERGKTTGTLTLKWE
ncbi:MAG TPA: ABC transporter permease, partial [Geobacterales bacterium]|nr:ABC transporter permease [Geobacterales bacterium]